jgi:hypothetical protein
MKYMFFFDRFETEYIFFPNIETKIEKKKKKKYIEKNHLIILRSEIQRIKYSSKQKKKKISS